MVLVNRGGGGNGRGNRVCGGGGVWDGGLK